MNPHHIRVCSGLLTALLVAAILKLFLIDIRTSATTGEFSLLSMTGASLAYVASYGLVFSIAAVLITELVRLRSAAVHLALGITFTFAAAYFSSASEALSSPVFSGGTLTSFALLIIGALSALAYWGIAGRRAGWRGNTIEHDETIAMEAFRTASAHAEFDRCTTCLAGRAAVGAALFIFLCWASLGITGMRGWLISQTEASGNAALKEAGYEWAAFRVNGARGVLEGNAPDEVQLRAAHDVVRDTLDSVTGFPGVLSKIENRAVAQMPMSAMSKKLADATRSETEARVDAEAARIATAAARAAEAEAKRKAGEQVLAAEAEIKRKAEEQTRATEAEIKRMTEEQALAAEAEIRRRLEEQARVALAEDTARKQAAQKEVEAARQVEIAALETEVPAEASPSPDSPAPSATDVGAEPAEIGAPPQAAAHCTSQDLAIVESSRILFAPQQFEVLPAFEPELDRLAISARSCAPRPILISGHADASKDILFNPALALQRARTIRDKLVERGASPGLVIAESAGTRQPIDNDPSHENRALNRRADFKFLEAAEVSRDATLSPDERANTCESELSGIMSKSIIHFPIASSGISAESMGLVKSLANAIQKCGSVIVTVEGHTDKIGAASYNQGLSEARATAVREALVTSGADPTRLASRGFASSRPYDSADTAEAFALNRRIEFKVSGKFTSTSTGGP